MDFIVTGNVEDVQMLGNFFTVCNAMLLQDRLSIQRRSGLVASFNAAMKSNTCSESSNNTSGNVR